MGDLFWNKVAAVLIAGVLSVMVIMELGHMLVPSHGSDELTEENTAYPVDWAAVQGEGGAAAVEEETGPTDYGVVLAAASIDAGARVARRCAACHNFEQGGANGTGPALWNIVGNDIASAAGFGYSSALAAQEGGWTFEALDTFLTRPAAAVPGTSMSFNGISNDDQRFALIAYLRSLSDAPVDLPAPLAAAEAAVEAVMEDDAVEAAIGEADAAAADAEEMAGELAEEAGEMAPEPTEEDGDEQ